MSGNAPERHPSVEHQLRTLAYGHLPEYLQEVSRPFCELGLLMANTLASGPELVAGLRKLREAKDCMVMQRVIEKQDRDQAQDVAENIVRDDQGNVQ